MQVLFGYTGTLNQVHSLKGSWESVHVFFVNLVKASAPGVRCLRSSVKGCLCMYDWSSQVYNACSKLDFLTCWTLAELPFFFNWFHSLLPQTESLGADWGWRESSSTTTLLPMLFADDVVLLASLSQGLQCVQGQ